MHSTLDTYRYSVHIRILGHFRDNFSVFFPVFMQIKKNYTVLKVRSALWMHINLHTKIIPTTRTGSFSVEFSMSVAASGFHTSVSILFVHQSPSEASREITYLCLFLNFIINYELQNAYI